MYSQCQAKMTFCGGYIGGGGETMLLNHQLSPDNKFSICPIGDEGPSPMAMEQAVMNYGGAHPERWNDDMLLVVGDAFQATWSCR